MTLSTKQQGHFIILGAMLIFGLNIPVTKYLYQFHVISPMAVTLFRMTFAAVMFWLVSLFLPKEKVAKKDLLILLVGGLLGMALNQGCFAYGINLTSPVDASLIATSAPLFAMILAAVILKEPITVMKFGGVIVGGIGAVILVYSSNHASNSVASWQGNLAIFCAQAFYATYLVITKPLSSRYSAITMMKWMFLFSAIAIFPLGISDALHAPLYSQDIVEPYYALAFILIGSTFIAYALIPLAQRRIRPTTISMYNNLQPLIASTIAITMGMDSFTLAKAVSGLCILGGVYLVTMSKSKADLDEKKLETENNSK